MKMNIRFTMTANCIVKNADTFPEKSFVENAIKECLKDQMDIDAEIHLDNYSHCNF